MRSILLVSAAALALAACGQQTDTAAVNATDANVVAEAAPEAPLDAAPEPAAAPAPAAEPVAPAAIAQEAQALDETITTAPASVQDYSFDEGGTRVRAWRDARRGWRLSEGADNFFYRPGDDAPYLVRDRDWTYTYAGGRLTGVLDRQGRQADAAVLAARRAEAERLLARARMLRSRADQHAPAPVREAEQRRRDQTADRGDRDRDRGGQDDEDHDRQDRDRQDRDRQDNARQDQGRQDRSGGVGQDARASGRTGGSAMMARRPSSSVRDDDRQNRRGDRDDDQGDRDRR